MWNKKKLAERSLERLQDAANAIADDVRAEARGRLKHAVGRTQHRARGVAKDADGLMREKTLLLLGIATGAGILAGLAMRGRRPPPVVTGFAMDA